MTAEGAGGGDGPEREPRRIRPFDDYLYFELGAVTLRQEEESSRVVQLGGLASGVSSLVNEWCKTYTAVDTSPLHSGSAVLACPRNFPEDAVNNGAQYKRQRVSWRQITVEQEYRDD